MFCYRLSVMALAIAVVACSTVGSASAQRKFNWKTIDEAESRLKVMGDALGMERKLMQRGQTGDYKITCFHQAWQAFDLQLEAAACRLEQFNWFYRPQTVEKATASFKFFQEADEDWGAQGRLVRNRGVMDTRQFRHRDYHCFAFHMLFGVNGESGQPNRNLRGYYCQRPALDEATIEVVVDAIGFEDDRFGFVAIAPKHPPGKTTKAPPVGGLAAVVAAPPAAVAAGRGDVFNVPLAVVWEGNELPLLGRLEYTQGRGEGVIHAAAGDVTCTGAWSFMAGEYGTDEPPRGTWSITCSNGKAAGGAYTSTAPGKGTGHGVGSDLNKVRFTFGEG